MLDEEQRQELTARLESLGDTSQEGASESAEPAAEGAEEQVEDRQQAEPVAAEADSGDVEASDSSNGRQSGAQRRISELVRQRNSATEEFRGLQDRYSALETHLQQMQQAPPEQQPDQGYEQQQYFDEYGNPIQPDSDPNAGHDLNNLREEFDQYRESQVIEQVKTQLESEIHEALSSHPDVDGQWLRKQLIDAVRLNGNADIAETAEYYSAFVNELRQSAVSKHSQVSERQALAAPPRLSGRSTASGSASQQGDQPFTREDARKKAYEIIAGS